jgi:DNA-binding MarR family transcriptional regulator
MSDNNEILLRAILSMTARQVFSVSHLSKIVLKGSGEKQLRAYNMCDGSRTQGEIAKATKLDPASFSRTVARWAEAGALFRMGFR